MSTPTAKDKKERAVHLRRVQQAAVILEKHGYGVEVVDTGTYDMVVVDRALANEKVSLEHVQKCLQVNGLGLMHVCRYSMLMATVDDVRNPVVKREGGNHGNKSRAGKSKSKR